MSEERAALSAEERQRADRLRELALYGIAGEFAGPLNLIALNREYLQMHLEQRGQAYSQEKVLQALRDIDAAARLLNRLADNFTELCGCLCGAVTPSAEAIDLYALLRSLCADSGQIYQAIGVHLALECEPGPEAEYSILADAILTERVLLNLLTFGLQNCPREGRVVFTLEKRKDEIRLAVQADGRAAPSPLEAFASVEESGAAGQQFGGGSAVGLYLCREYSRLMGWKMDLQPSPAGLCLCFKIPVRTAELEGRVLFHSAGQEALAGQLRFRAALLRELRCIPGLEDLEELGDAP